jgi:hypothetical protein
LTGLLAMKPAIRPRMIQLNMPMSKPPMRRPAVAECAVWTGKTQAGSLSRHIFELRR